MVQSVTYHRETKSVPFQGKTIVLESLTPVLSPKEKEKRKKEIERCLYEVFSKYRKAVDNPA
ncbi:MAG: hypothetical protein IJ390_01295 [Lachnospiraceae bacterium]|nr:hypothetical protein [Lachnospiraceae bacterium]